MGILVDRQSRVICQASTGRVAETQVRACLAQGTRFVAGVTPGRGGQVDANGLPLFETVRQAVRATGAEVSLNFVPAAHAAESILEAAEAGIGLVIAIAEGVPVLDMVRTRYLLKDYPACQLLGPNCPGLIVPGECSIGIIPGSVCTPPAKASSGSSIGIVSKSGSLIFEAAFQCGRHGIGQSACIGIGGDPIKGMGYAEVLELFERDPQTDGMLLLGEIGGEEEHEAADYIRRHVRKPVAACIVGRAAPRWRSIGHAGAVVTSSRTEAESKIGALRAAGAVIAESPGEIAQAMIAALGMGANSARQAVADACGLLVHSTELSPRAVGRTA